MRRFGLAFIVALLTFSASGVSALIIAEPCTGFQPQRRGDDDACPPTCVTCGCCAHPVEPVVLSIVSSPQTPVLDVDAFVPKIPNSRAREILHVPKVRFA